MRRRMRPFDFLFPVLLAYVAWHYGTPHYNVSRACWYDSPDRVCREGARACTYVGIQGYVEWFPTGLQHVELCPAFTFLPIRRPLLHWTTLEEIGVRIVPWKDPIHQRDGIRPPDNPAS